MNEASRSTPWRACAAVAVAAALLSLSSSAFIFLRVPTGADENSYVFQAWNFLEGRIARPAPPLPDQFAQEMIILDDRAGWLSRYPPGHPLWLAPGLAAGDVYAMVALAAALGAGFLAAAAAALGLSPLATGLLVLLSPFFAFMFGTQLSHTSGFLAVSVMLWAYARWRRDSGAGFALLAGLAWGFFFLNRTYTALLMAIPFGLDAVWRWWRQRTWTVFGQTCAFAAAAATGVAAYLLYNHLAVGDALTSTYLYYEPTEHLGFGPRRSQGMEVLHTPLAGLQTLWSNVITLDRWWWGFPGSLAALAVLATYGWSRRWSLLLLTAALAVWGGYVAFWYKGVDAAGGPAYYFETIPLLALLGAFGVDRLRRALAPHPRARRALAAGSFALLAALSLAFTSREGAARADAQRAKRDLADTLRGAPPRALVLLEKFELPHMGEIVFNPHGLDSDPLLLRSAYEDNVVAMRLFSNRTPFLLRGETPTALIPLPPAPMRLLREAATAGRRTGANEAADAASNRWIRVAREGRDAPGWLVFGKRLNLPAGRFHVRIAGHCEGVEADRAVSVDVASDGGRSILAFEKVVGARENVLATFELALTGVVTRVEPRVRYGGSGTVRVEEMVFEEAP